jgi:hypothetical protein
MFSKFIIDYKTNVFEELSKSTKFEDITNGRQGAILIDVKNCLTPIVRTTTIYNKPSQTFNPIHYEIVEKIRAATNMKDLNFNNALIEIYDSKYTTMGFHSDQAQDLDENSFICLFSVYDNASNICDSDIRKLVIKNKQTNESSEVVLDHNSIVLFSLKTNSEYMHKIILESNKSNNKWLGITFRLSKTFIKFINEIPYFTNGKELVLADENEKKEFYKFRGQENKLIDYKYPELYYTISKSDMLPTQTSGLV